MTVSTILVTATYPLDKHSSCFVIVQPHCTVLSIIENALTQMYPSYHLNPANYGLFVLPQKQWLFPQCLLSDYVEYLSPPKIDEFTLRHRNLVTINVVCLHYKCVLSCDPNQMVNELSHQAAVLLSKQENDHEFFKWKDWSIWEDGKCIPDDVPCSQLSLHTVSMRRENTTVDMSQVGPTFFRRPLMETVARENFDSKSAIPTILELLILKIESNPLVEGIFRKSGLQVTIDSFIQQVDVSIKDKNFDLKQFIDAQQPHDVTGILKSFFRMLPEPLIPPMFYDQFVDASSIPQLENRLPLYKNIIESMPSTNCAILKRLAQCMKIITSHSEENKMNMMNLVICVMPALVRNKADVDQAAMLNLTKVQSTIGCDLLDYPEYLYDSQKITVPSKNIKCISSTKINDDDVELEIGTVYQIVKDDKPDKFTVNVNDKPVEVPSSAFEREKEISVEPYNNWCVINANQSTNDIQYLPISANTAAIGVNAEVSSQTKRLVHAKNELKRQIKDLNNSINSLVNGETSNSDKEAIRQLLENVSMYNNLF